MKIDGACHCGAIRRARACACSRASPRVYVKTADSGNKRVQAFCADCGTPIYSLPVSAEFPFYSLRVGTMRQRAELRPSVEYFCRSKLGWIGLEGTRRYETMPG
jgi:hypothetical protein